MSNNTLPPDVRKQEQTVIPEDLIKKIATDAETKRNEVAEVMRTTVGKPDSKYLLGLVSGYTHGANAVLSNPAAYGLYSLEQVGQLKKCLWTLAALSKENGEPCDGYRFRELILEARELTKNLFPATPEAQSLLQKTFDLKQDLKAM